MSRSAYSNDPMTTIFIKRTFIVLIYLASAISALRSFYATCSKGLEPLLKAEVANLRGVEAVKQASSGVFFEGDDTTGFDALLHVRTALRLMENLAPGEEQDKPITSSQELYDLCIDMPWSKFIDNTCTFSVSMTLGQDVNEGLRNALYSSRTIQDAICDAFGEEEAQPYVNRDDPDVPLLAYLHRGMLSMYRCWSGSSSLHKRGYKPDKQHVAALRETTAAALVLASKWKGTEEQAFCDPMGGSGTLCIEAAMLAADAAPGLVRFAETAPTPCRWGDVDDAAWEECLAEARKRDKRDSLSKIVLYNDIHSGAAEMAREAARMAGVEQMIDFTQGDIDDFSTGGRPVLVMTNPPWDKRLQDGAADSWMKLNSFVESEPATTFFCLAGEPSLLRYLAFKPKGNMAIQGPIEMRLIQYHVAD